MFKKRKSDIQLIEQFLKNKDSKAFGKLYDRYADKVYGRCLSFFKDKTVAKDVTHDIFIKILYQLHTITEKQYFSTWLYSVTYRCCVDRYRAKKNNFFEDDSTLANDVVYEEDDTFFNDFYSHVLERGLSMLDKEERTILLMKYYDGLSVINIAEILNLKESAVKMRLKRSRDKLKSICLGIMQNNKNR
ncbi:MAG: RNA polymerase subunit sigma-70 [Flavobacteriales bacterium]|nr:MAG: RNA polymerase subunit sigma-70 [Flavobacteriales bacterium]